MKKRIHDPEQILKLYATGMRAINISRELNIPAKSVYTVLDRTKHNLPKIWAAKQTSRFLKGLKKWNISIDEAWAYCTLQNRAEDDDDEWIEEFPEEAHDC